MRAGPALAPSRRRADGGGQRRRRRLRRRAPRRLGRARYGRAGSHPPGTVPPPSSRRRRGPALRGARPQRAGPGGRRGALGWGGSGGKPGAGGPGGRRVRVSRLRPLGASTGRRAGRRRVVGPAGSRLHGGFAPGCCPCGAARCALGLLPFGAGGERRGWAGCAGSIGGRSMASGAGSRCSNCY